jgi:hypothetical protein
MAQPSLGWRFWIRDRIKMLSRHYQHFSSLYLEALEDRGLLDGSGPQISSSSPTEVTRYSGA